MNTIKWLWMAGAVLGWVAGSAGEAWAEVDARDFDGDGRNEATVFTSGKMIEKVLIDANDDGYNEMVVFYKNGYRNYAEIDADRNGTKEKRIDYYFTGAPWKISEDRNADGLFDYWMFFKDGLPYKWEQDRNGDGLADLQTVVRVETKEGKSSYRVVRQKADDDFDGRFEKRLGPPTHPSVQQITQPSGPAAGPVRFMS